MASPVTSSPSAVGLRRRSKDRPELTRAWPPEELIDGTEGCFDPHTVEAIEDGTAGELPGLGA